ncbi:GerAB/ArcD/ProY family transporter [Laceyella putida]|uniref:Endospore germination permease n=1 Tax=Laceyella putida TaxID=110101 RepID=A0ABW2RJ81_9BACL
MKMKGGTGMIERGRISAGQMALILYTGCVGVKILTAPHLAAKWAGRDIWLTPLVAAVSGVSFYLALKLHRRFPGETIIQYSPRILGWFGKGIALLYLVIYIHACSFVIRYYGEIVNGVFLLETPPAVVMGGMALVCAAAVRGGLETIVRSAQFLTLPAFAVLLTLTVLSSTEWEVDNLFPILEHGIGPVVRGAVNPSIWYSEYFLAAFLLPYVKEQDKAGRWGAISVFGSMLTLTVFDLIAVFVLGNQSATFLYPLFETFRLISLAGFFEHIDAFLLAMWLTIIFAKICLFQYVAVLGSAQWLGLSDYKPLSLPIAFILVAVSIWTAPNLSFLNRFLDGEGVFYSHLIQVVIPLGLLAVAGIRKVKGTREEGNVS